MSGRPLDAFERRDNAIHQLCGLMQRFENRFTVKGLSWCKAYLDRRMKILVNFDIGISRDAGYHAAVIQRTYSRAADVDEAGGPLTDREVGQFGQMSNG